MDGIGPRERIDSVGDIMVSQWSHYFTWGGRTPSMLFIQLFAWLGKVWFDFANTLVFVLLMLVLYWLAMGRIVSPGRHKGTFLWVMACMLFGVLDYPSTMLWMTGACVYLWTGLWECLFLLMMRPTPHPSLQGGEYIDFLIEVEIAELSTPLSIGRGRGWVFYFTTTFLPLMMLMPRCSLLTR